MMFRGVASLLVAGMWVACAWAEEGPLQAGRDVPPPATRKIVEPSYPPDAFAAGVGGIVIVEIVIDEEGNVASAEAIRSIPGLDEAALKAVRQWKYEVTKVDGIPVRVRHVVPVTFSRRLPHTRRQQGIPELRQGPPPGIIQLSGSGGPESTQTSVEVVLAQDGSVETIRRLDDAGPWTESLVDAVREWRFTPGSSDESVAFRIVATFIHRGEGAPRVELELTGLRVTSLSLPAPAPAPPAPSTASPQPNPDEQQASGSSMPSSEEDDAPAEVPAQPEIEVVVAAPSAPLELPEPPVAGTSSVPNVTLGLGVPDLLSGRQPIVPPFARLEKVTGSVDVVFSVDVSGRATVHGSEGHERLTPQAEGAVGSWLFRRTTTKRLFLIARFDYAANGAKANVAVRAPDSE